MNPVLAMRGIAKAFGPVKALDGAQLTLRAGEIHALMGENGAGKSTLIKVLTGVYSPEAGEILFDGEVIAPRSPREAESIGISTVYQEVNLVPTMSIADNIMLGRQPMRYGLVRKKELKRRAEAALERLGLRVNVSRSLDSCPMAVQQMVAIARALDVKAKLLVLDEPTSSLDEREVAFLFKILRKLRGEGMALLFVTHFLDQVYSVSDRITVLRNGAFVGDYTVSELPRLKLISAMLGRQFEEMQSLKKEVANERAEAPPGEAKEEAEVFLRARGLGKRSVMKPVDLEVAAGEVVGLAGLLGCGRTETARMLFGLDPADQGELKVDGKTVSIRSPRQAIRHGLAFCSEDRKTEGIVPHLSVRENLILAMQAGRGPIRRLPRKEQESLADHYIRALNIKTPNAEAPIANLSGGNQQKVLLARWLVIQPKLIILDEPTRGIDVGARAEIEKLVHSLSERGMAVLFISSELEEIVRTCERVTVLRDRQKAGELAGAEVKVNNIMDLIAHHAE
jgi:galactofuranose transport system ATP-binding protein